MVGEASTEDEEGRVAQEGAGSGRDESLPQHKDILMRKESAKDGGAFAFGKTAQENGDQPILLDEMMDGFRHRGEVCGVSRSSIRLSCSAIREISSRMPMIWLWRSSSSFSCSAMISISALRLTS